MGSKMVNVTHESRGGRGGRGGVVIYQNPKVPHITRYYESMGKMRLKIPKY